MSKRTSYFDGTLGLDSFASTIMVAGAAVFMFIAIVVGLLRFQATTTETLDAARRDERTPAVNQSPDILGATDVTASR